MVTEIRNDIFSLNNNFNPQSIIILWKQLKLSSQVQNLKNRMEHQTKDLGSILKTSLSIQV